MKTTKPKWFPLFCQCKDCLETFSIDGVMKDSYIIKLDSHPRIGHNGNGDYYHRCGGNGYQEGRLILYPMLKYWRS